MLDYLDFQIEIGPRSGEEYPLTVRSPAGEVRRTLQLPFSRETLAFRLQGLENALLRSSIRHRRLLTPGDQTVQSFGSALFDALFAGEVRSRYDVSRQEAAHRARGLRLKLAIVPPELAALPWEFLYDARQDQYLCLSRQTPLIRYLELPNAARPLAVAPPLRILGLVAHPEGLDTLDVAGERQRLETALRPLRERGLVELVWLDGQTWRDLQQAMWRGPWHILHFIGHGGFDAERDEGMIALANDAGRVHLLPATLLARLVADHDPLRLIVLNACEGARSSAEDVFSSTAAALVRQGTPAVLAMQYPISDDAAIELSRSFYAAVTAGFGVDTAVTEARKAISIALTDSIEWATPVLTMHAPDGQIFNIAPAPAAVDRTPAPQTVAAAEPAAGVAARPAEQPRIARAAETERAGAATTDWRSDGIAASVVQTAALGALAAETGSILLTYLNVYPSDATGQIFLIWALGGGLGGGIMAWVVGKAKATFAPSKTIDLALRVAAAIAGGIIIYNVAHILTRYTDRGTGLVEHLSSLFPVTLGILPVLLQLKPRLSERAVRAVGVGWRGALAAGVGSILLALSNLQPTEAQVPLVILWAIAGGLGSGVMAAIVFGLRAAAQPGRLIAPWTPIAAGILSYGVAYVLTDISRSGYGTGIVTNLGSLVPIVLGALPILLLIRPGAGRPDGRQP